MTRHAWRWVIALPYLVAVGPVVQVWSANVAMVRPADALTMVGIVLAITLAVMAAAWSLTRDLKRSAVSVAVAAVPVMTFGHQIDLLPPSSTVPVVPLLLVANAGLALFLIGRTWRTPLSRAWDFTTIGAAMFLLLSISGVAAGQLARGNSIEGESHMGGAGPDVYYIILDAYARADVLADLYGMDNAPFLDGLRARGFYIAESSSSNYAMTHLSLASTLSMQYLDEDAAHHPARMDDLIENAQVVRDFQSHGYKYVFLETSWFGTDQASLADVSIGRGVFESNFARVIVRTTLPGRFLAPRTRHDQILRAFDDLSSVPQIEEPTFTVAHLLIPHPPFMFRADGSVRPYVDDIAAPFDRAAYAEQVSFANRKVEELVDRLIATSPEPPVIIIQGDHGPALTLEDHDAETLWWERHSILNALLVPAEIRGDLYPTISPVNTFRALIPGLFGGSQSYLEDRSFFSWYDPIGPPAANADPLDFIEVTDTLASRNP